MTPNKNVRRPLGNFFIKRSLQMRIVGRIALVMLLSTILTTVFLATVYNQRSQEGSFYYMSNDIRQDIQLKSLLGIILPSVISAQVVSLLLGIGIGLFSSRKVAVPVYKFEKWANQMRKGNLKTRMEFRETNEMKDLSIECNELAEQLRTSFGRIDEVLRGHSGGPLTPESATRIKEELKNYEF